jgi:two-component system response regulator PilR (NtrC family)
MASVMIVEDDAILARSIEAHLSRQGFEVDVANNTFAALDRLDVRKFAVIITDIAMPRGMPNGVSLARMARVRDPNCHVILITGHAELARDGELFGAKVFVKPVDLDVLTAAIRKQIATPDRPCGG